MPLENLQALIDKQDTFESVRDQIALIIVSEVANQMGLAALDDKNPLDWKLRVFTEHSQPWEQLLNTQEDRSPIVNVWYESGTFPKERGNTVERQLHEGIFNIDIYGFGISKNVEAGGHTPGDKAAALEVQRGVRLVRNILFASTNTYLQLRGIVWRRWIQSIQLFQPRSEDRAIQNVVGARIALNVEFNEFAPQFEGEPITLIVSQVVKSGTGEVLLDATYNFS